MKSKSKTKLVKKRKNKILASENCGANCYYNYGYFEQIEYRSFNKESLSPKSKNMEQTKFSVVLPSVYRETLTISKL